MKRSSIVGGILISFFLIISAAEAADGYVLGTYSVGGQPQAMVYDSSTGSVWVINRTLNNVAKIRTSDGTILGTYAVGTNPVSIGFDPSTNSVWVGNYDSRTVTKLRASDGAVLGTYGVTWNPSDIAYDSSTNSMWVSLHVNSSGDINHLMQISAANGATLGTYDPRKYGAGAVEFDPSTNSIWVSHGNSVDPNQDVKKYTTSGTLLSTSITGGTPGEMIYDSSTASIWVANYSGNSVSKVRASDGTVLASASVVYSPTALAYDSTSNAIWAAASGENKVVKIRASDGAVLGRYPSTAYLSGPWGMAYDPTTDSIWIANANNGTITKMGNLPDLTTINLTGSGSFVTGNTISFMGNVQNAGNATAGASLARFCIDNASCLTSSTGQIGTTASVASLGAGASSPWVMADWTATVGSHTVYLCADVGTSVTETNENNNCSSSSFTVSPAPVNGACAASHYSCSTGTSGSNQSNATTWTWTCAGSNGGTTASCSETKPNYTITASASAGGTISPLGAVSVVSGASQAFTITPSAGYSIASVMVDGVNQGALTSYTFTNVTSNRTIGATFAPITPTVSLTYNPLSISYGGSTVISYTSTNATYCNIYVGGSLVWGNAPSAYNWGTVGPFYANQSRTVTCYNASGASNSDSKTLVVGAAPTASVSYSPSSITYGSNSTPSYTSSNTQYCNIYVSTSLDSVGRGK
jgi:DNA-binding beta-propeller fold protein YncE